MIMGRKDYQQLLVLQSMVEAELDRWNDVKVIGCETVREPDGLAMSSRNAYLAESDRDRALGLVRAMEAATEAGTVSAAEDRM